MRVLLISAAVTGLVTGSSSLASITQQDTGTCAGTQGGKTTSSDSGKKATKSKKEKHACKGQNACKGKGGCGTTKGKNDCKGKGECRTDGKPMEGER